MYLKSIEVNGFKSFANKIVFTFPHGITGIVGPNGSGKSNIADAVRWVLGEQSAKQLRGAKMEDVIFSGTQKRRPMGFAFVAITFDNKDHEIPVDYEEVTVARRVYRSGESEYLLNGSTCRRKDIVSLFFDTGIGKEGYSIIGQGQVEKILSGKIEDSRELFDEAAGIAKYKKNRALTMKSLEQERSNLARVTDILRELEIQVGPLEEQSRTAKEYLKLKEEEKNLDLSLFVYEYDHLNKNSEELKKDLDVVSGDLENTRDSYARIKERNQELLAKAEEIAASIESCEKEREMLHQQKEEQENEIRGFESSIESNTRLMIHYRELSDHAALTVREKEALLEETRNRIARKEESLNDEKEKLTALDQEIAETSARQEEQESKLGLLQQELLTMMSSQTDMKEKLSRYETLGEQLLIRDGELQSRIIKTDSDLDQLKTDQKDLESRIIQADLLMKEKDDACQDCKERQEKITAQIRSILARQDQLMQKQMMARSRYDTLSNMAERYDGYNRSIRHVMEYKETHPGIIGVVADIISVEKKYETAIEIALGASLQNIVTEDNSVAQEMIRILKKNKYGRATFLPLTNMRKRNISFSPAILEDEGVIGVASDLVRTDDRYRNLIGSLLGRTIVTDHSDHALALARKNNFSLRIVTLEGELFNPGGSITGGAFSQSANLLGRRREMEEAKAGYEELRAQWREKKAEADECKALSQELSERIGQLQSDLEHDRLAYQEMELKLGSVKTQIQELEQSRTSLAKEHRILLDQIAEIERQKEDLAEEEADHLRLHEQSNESIDEVRQALEKVNELLADLENKRQRMTIEYNKVNQEIHYLENDIERLQREKEEAAESVKGNEAFEKNLSEKNASLRREMEEVSGSLAKLSEKLAANTQKMEGFKTSRNEINTSQNKVFHDLDSENERLLLLEKENTRLQARIEKADNELHARTEYMWENYELTYHHILEMHPEELTEKMLPAKRKEKKAVTKKIRDLGPVNVNAIEEYKEVGERYSFLKKQHEDILHAEEQLVSMIDELNRNMRQRFREQFTVIREMFTQVFQDLFEGGTASLELMDDEDILESGIRIIAQPPGKKLQNILLLSGGERALTAIALLFAIQKLKPSPFCLLDEIEAALDDSNIIRFSRYLKRLANETQFIVITHRRGTMDAAEALYGITMQEKGVSTLISVDLIDSAIQ